MTCVLVFLILSTSSVINFILKRLKPNNPTFAKVATIINSWWLITGSFLIALAWQRWGIILFMYIITLFCIREYLKISKVEQKKFLAVALSLLTTIQYFLLAKGLFTPFLFALPVLCLWMVPSLVITNATIQQLELVTGVGLGLTLLIYYTSHIAALSSFPQLQLNLDDSTFAIFILILVTWFNDIFQFIAGHAFGKRKIVPAISPNKTLGGFIGGLIGTAILTALMAPSFIHLSLLQSLVLGLLLSFTGMFGDLFFSAVKRNIGVKDFSSALPGHGGLLDRLDSIVFTAPIYFYYIYFMRGLF